MSGPDEFVRGSVIVCTSCRRPIYALERGLGPWDRAGRAASAFRPLRPADIEGLLLSRPDVPTWWQQSVREWLKTPVGRAIYAADRPRAGHEASCPVCGDTWVQVEARESGTEGDKAYVWQMLDIPPVPSVRGRMRRRIWGDDGSGPDLEVEERPAL